jgi:glucose-1-phosphate thymidylyltransferase
MKAIIPVAGAGTRLRPHTHSTPKVLIELAGKPIIGHILAQLEGLPIDEVIMVVGQKGEMIKDYVDAHYKIRTSFIVQEEAKGLGDAIHLAKAAVGRDPALIILGDTIFKADFGSLLDRPTSLIGVKEVEDPRRFGVVETEGKRIVRLVEKPEHPESKLAIVGIYLIRETAGLFQAIETLYHRKLRTKGEYQLTDALQVMLEQGTEMETFPVDGWFDCGKPETLLETNRSLLEMGGFKAPDFPGSVVIPPVFIDPTAKVEHSIIGPHVSVAAGSHIKQTMVSNSIIGSKVLVEKAMLQGSLLGDNATVRGKLCRLNVGDDSEVDIY